MRRGEEKEEKHYHLMKVRSERSDILLQLENMTATDLCVLWKRNIIMQYIKRALALKDKYILTLIKLLFDQPSCENIYLKVN